MFPKTNWLEFNRLVDRIVEAQTEVGVINSVEVRLSTVAEDRMYRYSGSKHVWIAPHCKFGDNDTLKAIVS